MDAGPAFTGTAGNDTFSAADVGGAGGGRTWTVGDQLDGGAGNDVLNITTTGSLSTPVGATVTNIETVNVLTDADITLTTTGWTGLTALNTTGVGAATITGAATTALNVTSAGAIAGNEAIAVNGGSSVTVTSTNNALDQIAVGVTTAATGAVVVNSTGTAAGGTTAGAIGVTGGTSVTVNQNAGNAALTGNTNTGGVVTVTGNAATTSVTVNQSATAVGATATATTAGVVGFNAGQVVIADANAGTATADTIATVTLNSYGTASTVNSGALATLNLGSTGNGLTVNGSVTAANQTVNTLALNVNGLRDAAGTVTLNNYSTLNVAASTAASSVNALTAAAVTALNVSGDATVNLGTTTLSAALTAVNSTNTAGLTIGNAQGVNTAYTLGSGNDSIVLANGHAAAVTMGAGNDTVRLAADFAVPAAGTLTNFAVNAGEGTDTVAMTGAQAATFSGAALFNSRFSGFEVLDVATGASQTVNLAGINAVNNVVTRGAAGLQLDGFTSGGTLTLDAASATVAANVTNAVLNTGDVFNVILSNNTGGSVIFGTVTTAGIETLNISTVDAGTAANTAATVDVITLGANAQGTSIVVSGNNGLTVNNNGANTAITSFDASGVVGNSANDTAAGLAVTFASNNATATANVSITGGAGNDTLTGNAAIDTITGGAGNDIVTGGLGADIINVGIGRDVINIASAAASSDSSTGAFDTIKGFTLSSAITTAADLLGDGSAAGIAGAFQTSTAGGANFSLLSLNPNAINLNVEANATGVGQGAGVTYTVTNGILTLGGTGASSVDTLGKWLVEAAAVAFTAGDTLAFQFGSNTYVFAEGGASQDIFVALEGVTGATNLIEVTGTTTAAAGSILFADVV